MASNSRVGIVSEADFQRDSSFGFFFIGEKLTPDSEHRDCFMVSDGQLIRRCAICAKYPNCNLAWREKTL